MSLDVALYGHWICPFSTRVEFALHQRGIDHELVDLPPSSARPKGFEIPPEFAAHSPRLEIPMVRIGDEYLADSIPILEWLEDQLPGIDPLLPVAAEQQALVRERVTWIDQNAFRPMIGVYYGTEPPRIERAGAALVAALATMGEWAAEAGWLAGAAPTIADAVAMPIHVRLRALQRLGLVAPIPEGWARYGERCRTLPGWAPVEWSTEQEDEFVGRIEAYRRINQREDA